MSELHFDSASISEQKRYFRRNLINSLGGPKSLAIVGTRSSDGKENAALFNSVLHIGATPPLMGLIFRPHTVPRHTFENILDTEYYTINHVSKDILKRAHQSSASYEREESEFDSVGFKPVYLDSFNAPYVKESPVKIGLRLAERIDISSNKTILIIGAIEHIFLPEESLWKDGLLDPSRSGSLACAGLDAYYEPSLLARYSYPKPGESIKELKDDPSLLDIYPDSMK